MQSIITRKPYQCWWAHSRVAARATPFLPSPALIAAAKITRQDKPQERAPHGSGNYSRTLKGVARTATMHARNDRRFCQALRSCPRFEFLTPLFTPSPPPCRLLVAPLRAGSSFFRTGRYHSFASLADQSKNSLQSLFSCAKAHGEGKTNSTKEDVMAETRDKTKVTGQRHNTK